MLILIISLNGAVVGEVPLLKARTTLGRRPYNDIVMDSLTISGEHAVFHRAGNDVHLEDLNSTNGTYVNARAIQKCVLLPGDLVEVGDYRVRCIARDDPPLDDVPAQPPVAALSKPPVRPDDTVAQTVSSQLGGLSGVSARPRPRLRD
ncbi:hypothetical protein BH10PSE18_BH10PSE18_38760 [soil metagenome]